MNIKSVLFIVGFSAVLMTLGNVFVLNHDAQAVSGSCFFAKKDNSIISSGGTCKIDGYGNYGTNDVFTGRSTSGKGRAIPLSIAGNKTKFINFVHDRFYHGSKQDRIGAAFLIQNMRGARGWPSHTQVKEWETLMKQASVSVKLQKNVAVGKTSYYDNKKHNVFFGSHPTAHRDVVTVYQNGKKIAQIETECGNMLPGSLKLTTDDKPSKPKPGDGSSAGCAPIQIKVRPGADYYGKRIPVKVSTSRQSWGPYSSNKTIDATSKHTTGDEYTVHFTETRRWVSSRKAVYRNVTIKDKDGKTHTSRVFDHWQNVYSSPRSWTSKIGPCYDYDLIPEVGINRTMIEAGGEARVDYSVSNDQTSTVAVTPPSKSRKTNWQLTELVYRPNSGKVATPRDKTSGDSPCSAFSSSNRKSCDIVWDDDGYVFASGSTAKSYNYSVDEGIKAGSQVCFVASVSKPTENNSPEWRHSALTCMKVGKRPKMQVWGHDVRVRGDISTATSNVDGKTFGSWGEYGAFAQGSDDAFGSGAGLLGGTTTNRYLWSQLTFANEDEPYGRYGSLPTSSPIAKSFRERDLCTSASSVGTLKLKKGETRIYCTTGTFTIKGNINYDVADSKSIADIPQVVIIAKNIVIDKNVENVDAWLIASNSINTCGSVASPSLTIDMCEKPLRVNGPVITDKLYLNRTYGADGSGDDAKDTPAEVFNLRPITYLWVYGGLNANTVIQTVDVIELPPRF